MKFWSEFETLQSKNFLATWFVWNEFLELSEKINYIILSSRHFWQHYDKLKNNLSLFLSGALLSLSLSFTPSNSLCNTHTHTLVPSICISFLSLLLLVFLVSLSVFSLSSTSSLLIFSLSLTQVINFLSHSYQFIGCFKTLEREGACGWDALVNTIYSRNIQIKILVASSSTLSHS